MSPEGPVGKKYYEYITAETHFDRIARSHTLSDDMSNILFSHRKASLKGLSWPGGFIRQARDRVHDLSAARQRS